jgi:hypothetical protein
MVLPRSSPACRPELRLAVWVVWPVGLVLALASALRPAVPLAVSAGLNLVYVVGVVALVRALGGRADRPASALVLAGAGIFALAGLTGEPTAREPGIMLLNTAVLATVAVTLMIAATGLALRCGAGPARTPAALGMVALVIGSGGYLVNLLARWAVVLSGAADLQAAVEDSAWVAYAYLPGLDTEPTFLGYLLVLFDLVQLAYVVLTYLGFGALASALGRAGHLRARAACRIGLAGTSLAGVATAAAFLAGSVGPTVGTVAAWTAFVLTIPFMTTLLPCALGLALLRSRAASQAPSPPKPLAAPLSGSIMSG